MRTTFITGFPGETDEQFDELVEFVGQQQFERLGVFTYSFEPDTPAARLPDHLPDEVKKPRRERLMAVQQEIAFAWNAGAESAAGATCLLDTRGARARRTPGSAARTPTRRMSTAWSTSPAEACGRADRAVRDRGHAAGMICWRRRSASRAKRCRRIDAARRSSSRRMPRRSRKRVGRTKSNSPASSTCPTS